MLGVNALRPDISRVQSRAQFSGVENIGGRRTFPVLGPNGSMATSSIADVFEAYAQQGLYAIPAKIGSMDDGLKSIKETIEGNWAIMSPSDWRAAQSRINEFIKDKQYKFMAIKTGAILDIFVLDVDIRDKSDDDLLAGMPLRKRLVAEHGEPDTLRATTASGGYHYYFSYGGSLKEGL
jgi:hypothetical protein